MQKFQQLIVWQKAHQLVLEIYGVTKRFPLEERYGLTSQMRRAAVSVPANIVEGHKRMSKREFVHFVSIAEGSLEELKYYCWLAKDLEYLSVHLLNRLYGQAEEVGRMLHGLKRHLKKELTDG